VQDAEHVSSLIPVCSLTVPLCVQERVAAAGGTVLNNSGLRVMGILQCTRAIGDKDLQPYGVTPVPDVVSLPRTGREEFLVLATDGLWDVMSNEVGV
jgi:protein phosphatase 2C